jgi:hypothetical protein
MLEWVWFAGGGRLKHMALMRASAASRRFAGINVIILALSLALFQVSGVGWRLVTASPAVEASGSVTPAGRGWFHVASAPRPLPPGQAPEVPVDLWWNPAQAILAWVATLLGAMIAAWIVLAMVRGGVQRAHTIRYRLEQRMTAAIHYGTAWCLPVVVGAVIASVRPLAYAGQIERWKWYVSERIFLLSGGVFAGFGAVMCWFWFIRLGFTAPERTRSRVVALWGLGAPLCVAAVAAGSWYGLSLLLTPLFAKLEIQF